MNEISDQDYFIKKVKKEMETLLRSVIVERTLFFPDVIMSDTPGKVEIKKDDYYALRSEKSILCNIGQDEDSDIMSILRTIFNCPQTRRRITSFRDWDFYITINPENPTQVVIAGVLND